MGLQWRKSAARPGSARLTYFNWNMKYNGLLPTEIRRLKQLEEENGKLKKLVADLSLDKGHCGEVGGASRGGQVFQRRVGTLELATQFAILARASSRSKNRVSLSSSSRIRPLMGKTAPLPRPYGVRANEGIGRTNRLYT
ncbi:hypothetical protein ABIF86_000378 [Bradyrhizobium japonicum]